MKIQIGLFYQYISSHKFKPVFRCKQIDNKKFKTVNVKSENSEKKNKQTNKQKTFFWILKIRHGILLYSKTFFQFFKIRGGWWRTTK